MSNCVSIQSGALYDCDNKLVAGVENNIWVIPFNDVVNLTKDVNGVVTGITLASGKKAYVFEGVKRSVIPEYTFAVGTLDVNFIHRVAFSCFDISQPQKKNLQSMGLTKNVVITQNKNVPGNKETIFELFGEQIGLEIPDGGLARLPNDQETNGSFSVTLESVDTDAREPDMPVNIWNSDFDTTLAILKALEQPQP